MVKKLEKMAKEGLPKVPRQRPWPEPPEEKISGVKKIRMLRSLGTARGAYYAGQSYKVGKDLPLEWAENWLRAGAAEEDKDLEGPEETK